MSEELMMKYFVLKPAGTDIFAKASRRAMAHYASEIREEHPEFAAQIREWAAREGVNALEAQEAISDE